MREKVSIPMQEARIGDAYRALYEARVAVEFAVRKYRTPEPGTADYGESSGLAAKVVRLLEEASVALQEHETCVTRLS